MNPLKDKELLRHLYIDNQYSIRQIAAMLNCSRSAVFQALHRFEIPMRQQRKFLSTLYDQKWLEREYIEKKQSAEIIARSLKCHPLTVLYWLRKHQIPVRSHNEATHLANGRHLKLQPPLIELLEGELLGDGCLLSNKWSAHYEAGSKYRTYLEWLKSAFALYGLQGGSVREKFILSSQRNGKVYRAYAWRSFAYEELLVMRNRWYPSGKKIVPSDLNFTPIVARQWYLGDGHLKRPRPKRPHGNIILATNGFSDDDRAILIERLAVIKVEARVHKRGELYINVRTTPIFLKYIGRCPEAIQEIYGYKWALPATDTL